MKIAEKREGETSKALVVEDECDTSLPIECHLNRLGIETVTATDGESGLREAESGNFDIIVLDVMLPSLSGLEVCRILRHPAKGRGAPIVLLTAASSAMVKAVAEKCQVEAVVLKPFRPVEFVRRIQDVLNPLNEGEPGEGKSPGTGRGGVAGVDKQDQDGGILSRLIRRPSVFDRAWQG